MWNRRLSDIVTCVGKWNLKQPFLCSNTFDYVIDGTIEAWKPNMKIFNVFFKIHECIWHKLCSIDINWKMTSFHTNFWKDRDCMWFFYRLIPIKAQTYIYFVNSTRPLKHCNNVTTFQLVAKLITQNFWSTESWRACLTKAGITIVWLHDLNIFGLVSVSPGMSNPRWPEQNRRC